MRRLLLHEKKLVEIMLQRNPLCDCPLPDIVVEVSLRREPRSRRPVTFNQSFTNYFRADTANTDLELVDCHLCVPNTIGNELFLVKDVTAGQLAFMEFMNTPLDDDVDLTPYVRSISEYLRVALVERDANSLVSEFRSLFGDEESAQQDLYATLGHVRLLVSDRNVCFFIGTGDSLLIKQPDEALRRDAPSGSVQLLSLGDDIACEGWVSWPNDPGMDLGVRGHDTGEFEIS